MDIELAVGWLFLAIFAVLAVISILDLVKIVEIRDENRRKWLFRSVLGCVVLAVGGFGKAYYDDRAKRLEPSIEQPARNPKPSDVVGPTASGTTAPSPAPTATPAEPPPFDSRCESRAPESLRKWANEVLGERPNFSCKMRDRYPPCIAELQGRAAAENSPTEARDCGKAIEQFRRDEITPVLTRKVSYQVNLDNAEATTRSAASPEEIVRREYVVAEIARMNGSEWDRFVAVDRESYRDLGACNSQAKCTLAN